MFQEFADYFSSNTASFLAAVRQHIVISLVPLAAATIIAIPAALVSIRRTRVKTALVGVFQSLRIIPSLAVLLLLLPVLGVGFLPAAAALTLLAIPPILLNTIAGLEGVPYEMRETAAGLGMTEPQIWMRVRIPLALPMILTGLRIATVEVISSATLAAKIGAGGLGEIIFTGLGLNRTALLLIGGVAVAVLSLAGSLLFVVAEKKLFLYRQGK